MPNEGDIVRNKRTGEQAIWRGGRPVPIDGAAPVAPPASGPVYGPPPKVEPFAVEDQQFQRNNEVRAQQDQQNETIRLQMEQERLRLAQEAAAKSTATTGKMISATAQAKAEGGVGQFEGYQSARDSFVDDFGGNVLGGLENTAQGIVGDAVGTPGQRNWWANFKRIDNQVRNELFGATLTPSEQKSYNDTTISPGLSPEIIRDNLKQRTDILAKALDRQRRFMIANGYNAEAVEVLYEPLRAAEALAETAEVGAEQQTKVPALTDGEPVPAGDGDEPRRTPGAGDNPSPLAPAGTDQQVDDPTLSGVRGRYKQLLQAKTPPGEVVKFLREMGVTNAGVLRSAAAQASHRIKTNTAVDQYNTSELDDMVVPLSGTDQVLNAAAQSPVGAYAVGAGNFLSGNNLDSMTSNPERTRLGMNALAGQYPTATAAGEVSGGIMGAMVGEAGLARLGMAPGFVRGAAADSAFGAVNGAGSADSGSRVLGAAGGAVVSGAGSAVGQGITRGIGRAIAPTGGGMNALYAAGVRPTLGQRVADKGVVGRAVNGAEEALQSVPVVGSAISSARQEARDQFQVGAFNEALKEVGEQLPKGLKPGTDPHAYAQATFDRVYAQARAGMMMVADQQLGNDIAALAPDIQALGPEARGKLKAIFANALNGKLKAGGGTLSGEAYKKAISDIGKRIAQSRRGSTAEDQALADVLEDMRGALDAAARRHSHPDAVALLDAADAGYAKLVRIEDAAQRAGGEAGTFSPTQFNRATQKTSGGVRSRSYLRGDALMQDYAEQGRNLVDRTPDSGTPIRALTATTVAGGAAYLEPSTLTVLGALGALYAPGARRAMQAAIAPAGPRRRMIAQQLKKRARLVGAVAGATGGSAALGTTPSQ